MKKCKLCKKDSELQNSHIYPKFIGKWMKNTGGDRFRIGSNMNKPEQDFPKQKLLCKQCENKFSRWEKQFSEKLFKPLMNKGIHFLEYEDWFYKLLLSVLWRILSVRLLKPLTKNDQKFEKELIEAEKEWRLFLNGVKEEIQFDNIQVFITIKVIFDNLDDISGLNYYLLRAVDSDICSNQNNCFIYAKFARFIIWCPIVNNDDSNVGIRIINGNGILTETQFKADNLFVEYLFNRMKKVDQLEMSDIQQEKMIQIFIKKRDHICESDLEKTMKLDFQRGKSI